MKIALRIEIMKDCPTLNNKEWTPQSWQTRTALQQPEYADPAKLETCLGILRSKPPLVSKGEIDRLRDELADAAQGKRFVLHGGDCAERFTDCTASAIESKLKVLLQMSLVLTYGTRKPLIRIGRMAGQYAKPRSNNYEEQNGEKLPVYRGDLVNETEFDAASRNPNSYRMIDGYHHSAACLNYLRALIEGGFADLHHPELWNLSFMETSPNRKAYQKMVDAINDSITFMETISQSDESLRRVEFYTSHEALLLPYEEALTRYSDNHTPYNHSAHYLWLGYRTSGLEDAHVEYLRGIRNPIGIKAGAAMNEETLIQIIDRIDPDREPGRITIITRFGADNVSKQLPRFVQAVEKSGHKVVWSCDPMHGNTETAVDGLKTRRLDAIFSELEQTFEQHNKLGTFLGGVHIELTGEAVTECIGGSGGVTESDLHKCYETACDPRLNGMQALEMAFLLARLLR
jgi:3-deoxy-7-phosphoheptulonate synthase